MPPLGNPVGLAQLKIKRMRELDAAPLLPFSFEDFQNVQYY